MPVKEDTPPQLIEDGPGSVPDTGIYFPPFPWERIGMTSDVARDGRANPLAGGPAAVCPPARSHAPKSNVRKANALPQAPDEGLSSIAASGNSSLYGP